MVFDMTARHEPTPETRVQVKTLASVGTPQDQIAIVIGITKNTLLKYYRKELDSAMTMANAKVAQSLFQQATAGNTSAAIFWLKCRAGWVDKQSIEHSGQIQVKQQLNELLDEISEGDQF